MSYNFIKISDVEMIENPNTDTKVLVEDDGDIKRVPKSAIGAQADWNVSDESSPAFIKNKPNVTQADWNETDDTNPAYILNKPANLGGYMYYYYYNYYLYKCEDFNFNKGDTPVTENEFQTDFYSHPILFKPSSYSDPSLIVSYNNAYNRIHYVSGNSIYDQDVQWNYI